MKKFKKLIVVGAALLVIAATSITALAATGYANPAEILAGLTGKPVESVIAEKSATGATYGTLAINAGVSEEFKLQMLEQMKARLAERVKAGLMKQERADAIIAAMEANQALCDGTGAGGSCTGAGFGGMMKGQGKGYANGGINCGMGKYAGAGLTT